MNESRLIIHLKEFMDSSEGWGRSQGREVYQKLIDYVEAHPGVMVFHVSIEGIRRVDISFASETVIEIAKKYRSTKGFCFIDLKDKDMLENWDAAAERKVQPIMVWDGNFSSVIGVQPSQGNLAAFHFALDKRRIRAAEFAADSPNMSIANASTKFKNLYEQGFLLRREESADSGGVEYLYYIIK